MALEGFEDFLCPYCGESNGLSIDYSSGPQQEFVVDCEVCCAPILVRLKLRGGTIIAMDIERENG